MPRELARLIPETSFTAFSDMKKEGKASKRRKGSNNFQPRGLHVKVGNLGQLQVV